MNPDRHPRRGTRPRATRGEVKLALAALFAVVVLLMTLATTTSPDASHVVSVGEQLPPAGRPLQRRRPRGRRAERHGDPARRSTRRGDRQRAGGPRGPPGR
uniref:Uncharacterized protein n=1 Tax=Janibacter limosus TaxID=53458 RepID=A0AC61U3U5_9MICO|nr:hypothetical protein [Janibacter limosus]